MSKTNDLSEGERLYRLLKECKGKEEPGFTIQQFLIRENLEQAIDNGDRPRIEACLKSFRSIGAAPSVEDAMKINSCRGGLLKTGPKPGRNRHNGAIVLYEILCAHRQLAWAMLNRDRRAFTPNLDGPVLIQPGSSLPVWKYPDLERERKRVPLPSKGKIKEFICGKYGIERTTFDSLKADDSREGAVGFFNRLCRDGNLTIEEAKKQTCEKNGVRARDLDRWLADDKK